MAQDNREPLTQDRTDLAEDRTVLAHERSFASWLGTVGGNLHIRIRRAAGTRTHG